MLSVSGHTDPIANGRWRAEERILLDGISPITTPHCDSGYYNIGNMKRHRTAKVLTQSERLEKAGMMILWIGV